MREKGLEVDLCVVGGGMAGICAAISAARHGLKVALMHDRPVLGGNASSEIRMWICGANGENMRETGILEEIQMENLYRNPTSNYHIWDSILYEKVRFEDNITLLLNCTCVDATIDANRIVSVRGWQMTNETWHTVTAKLFADCSGDGILAPLTNADHRIGREASHEYNESLAPKVADKKTMGMSCLFQIRETNKVQKFIPPTWAYTYPTDDDLPYREHHIGSNYWWIELGGDMDSIHDTEEIKDELLKIAFGVWDHIKNHGDHGAENWILDWVGFLPGKRESRRYIGDLVLTQNHIEAEGRFDDIVAYGGWTMDDHFPEGFKYPKFPTIFHPTPSPYGIPYRCLYSRNIENLYFAGRNISVTHMALSSTRVMGTCSLLGQAVGTAASIAVKKNLTPRGVYQTHIPLLQQILMEDDCYIPWKTRKMPELTLRAKLTASSGNPLPLINGIDRPVAGVDNGWTGTKNDWLAFMFEKPEQVRQVRLLFDSNLNRSIHNLSCVHLLDEKDFYVPKSMVKVFRIEIQDENKNWICAKEITNNYQRLVKIRLNAKTYGVRFVPLETWDSDHIHLFGFNVE